MEVNILLVDDDQDINYTFKSLLEAGGYHVYTAVNEEQAKALVKERIINLSIIDYLLEDASGIMIARALKGINESLKIILLSGFLEVLDVVDELGFCISKVFLKPVDPKAFLDTVNSVLMEPHQVDRDMWIEKQSIY